MHPWLDWYAHTSHTILFKQRFFSGQAQCYLTFSWIELQMLLPNGPIFVDSPSIRRRNSTWKVRQDIIDFERWIHVEIMTSIRRGNFDVDSTFKIDKISMSFPRGFFYVVSTSNRHNFCTRCFYCIIS